MEKKELILKIPGAILHLIDKSDSFELASGDLEILRHVQGEITVAVFARVADNIQWPLTKNEPAVKVDKWHYLFFDSSNNDGDILNYGLTIALNGQDPLLLEELDRILTQYNSFTVEEKVEEENNVLDLTAAKETSSEEKQCTAYWTTLAPNVEDYSGVAARLIAAGSGKLIKRILLCGDLTIDGLIWGTYFMKQRLTKAEKEREVNSAILKSLKSMKKMTKTTKKMTSYVLSGIIKKIVFFLSLVVNSKAGKKFFGLPLGEMVLSMLDGFNKVFDAVEIAGRNVIKTSSNVTTEIIDHKYGAKTAHATYEGLGAAWHALGTAWTVFNIRQALNPKSTMKPSSLAEAAITTTAKEKTKGKKSSK